MNIEQIIIEKFRSIKKVSFNINDITAIVGENNSGKTSVLRAINAVLNYSFEEEFFVNRRHQYAQKSNTHITITFNNIPDDERLLTYVHDEKITLCFSYIYSENKRKLSITKGTAKVSIDEYVLAIISEHIMYVYIPAGRSNKDILWKSDSIFKQLVLNYAAQYTEKKDMISGQVRNAAKKIHDSVFTRIEQQLEKLYMQNKHEAFNLSFPDNLDYTFLINNLVVSLNEYDKNYPLQECGSGIKSLVVIAMHRANALLRNGTTVLGIEEPETNLHPQAQKRFMASLQETIGGSDSQALFTTHSTVLVDALPHQDILLIRRVPDPSRGFISTASKIPQDFWTRYDIEEFKHYQYFNYRNSDFFFSKFVVLGESKNDCQVFQMLVKPHLGSKMADVSFLDAGGVENIKYPYFLLKELKIPFIMIVDKDYFFPYQCDNELSKSRNNKTGLPLYADTLKDDPVINDIFSSDVQQRKLVDACGKGYRKFFEFLKPHGILSMNYCLEMDLTCSSAAREKYYDSLNILQRNRNQKYLLENNHKSIKKIEKILKIVDTIPHRNLPESYLKIQNEIVEQANLHI